MRCHFVRLQAHEVDRPTVFGLKGNFACAFDHKPVYRLEERRLSRAVWPQQSDHGTARHDDGYPLQIFFAPKGGSPAGTVGSASGQFRGPPGGGLGCLAPPRVPGWDSIPSSFFWFPPGAPAAITRPWSIATTQSQIDITASIS